MNQYNEALKREPFWLVWCPQGHAPTVRHSTERSAVSEAQRLAKVSKGMDFYVLSSSSGWVVPETPVVQLDLDPEFIPF